MDIPTRRVLRSEKPKKVPPCIPNECAVPEQPDVPVTEGFDFFTSLSKYYDITHIISKYLSKRDLYTVASILPQWSHLERETKKRNQLGWLMMFSSKDSFEFKGSDNINYINRKFGICYYNCKLLKPSGPVTVAGKRKIYLNYLIKDMMHSEQSDADVLCIGATLPLSGIISLEDTLKEDLTLDNALYHTTLFLPEIKNVLMKQFKYNLQSTKKDLEQLIPDFHKLDCLLVFSIGQPDKILPHFFRNLSAYQSTDITIGGGIIYNIGSNRYSNINYNDIFCVGFFLNQSETSETPEFNSASIVIKEYDISASASIFKSNLTIREKSVLFCFTCSAKDCKDTEGPYLRELFPTSIVHHIEVMGEVGSSNYRQKPFSDKRKMPRRDTHIATQLSTILVFITWGKVISPR